ncbi:MAG: DUF928 domain-containing protein [Cyanobacteria bacterium P01_E01_bin.42]
MKATKPRKFLQQIVKVVFLALLTLSLVLSQSSYARLIEPLDPQQEEGAVTPGHRVPQCTSSKLGLHHVELEFDRSLPHPTFAWFVESPDRTEVEVKFNLYELDNEGKPSHDIVPSKLVWKKPGLQTYTPYRTSSDGLLPNKNYEWRVSLLCDPNSSVIESVSIKKDFKVEEMTPVFAANLENTSDRCQKLSLFQQAGLGYNLLNTIINWGKMLPLESVDALPQWLQRSCQASE